MVSPPAELNAPPARADAAGSAEYVRSAYAAFAAGNLAGFLAFFDSATLWEEPPAHGHVGRRFIGRDAIAKHIFGSIDRWYEGFSMELEDTVSDGSGRVVALGRYEARFASGDMVSSAFAHVWRFHGDRAVAFRDFHDRSVRIGILEGRIASAVAGSAEALAIALSAKDGYTADHAGHVAELAVAVASKLRLCAKEVETVRHGALLHDIGKIAIPDEILHKRGALTEAEWETVKRHPEVGEEIIAPLTCLLDARKIVRHDHERWDGEGYPDRLAREEIPLGARIVCAVDAYHAMTSTRPYRAALSDAQARAELRAGAGSQFDPSIVATLLEVLEAR